MRVANCANTGDPTYCSQIVRSPSTGSLTGNSITSGGFVIQKNYNLGTAVASAYLQHNVTQPLPGAHTYDCASIFGFTCQTINPRWHHLFRTTWATPWKVSASVTWRYIGAVSQDNNSSDPTLHFSTFGAYDYYNARIPGYNYFDLEATWDLSKIVQIRVGANNVLDKDPPIINTDIVVGGAANTYSTYDLFGRQLFVAFSAKF